MDITFGLWHIVILGAASGLGLILAANAKYLWDNRQDTAIVTGIVIVILSGLTAAIYGTYRSRVWKEIAYENSNRIAKDQYLPGIWDDVFNAVDNVYGWEAKWAIVEAVPVRYGIENVHALPGQGFSMILREFHGQDDLVLLRVRQILRPYVTPFPDPQISCADSKEKKFGAMLVVHQEEGE